MRRFLSAASLASVLLLPLASRASTFAAVNTTGTGAAPAGLGESIALQSGSFTTVGNAPALIFTFSPTGSGTYNTSQALQFAITITGASGTETVTESGTLNFTYFDGTPFVGSSFTSGTQTISGPAMYNVVYTYNFNSAYPNGTVTDLYAEIFPNAAFVAPTPEPQSLVLLGTGLLGMVGAGRRRFLRRK